MSSRLRITICEAVEPFELGHFCAKSIREWIDAAEQSGRSPSGRSDITESDEDDHSMNMTVTTEAQIRESVRVVALTVAIVIATQFDFLEGRKL